MPGFIADEPIRKEVPTVGYASPMLLELRDMLRREMPKGFFWYFPDIFDHIMESWYYGNLSGKQVKEKLKCNTSGCAIGLAHLQWPDKIKLEDYAEIWAEVLDIPMVILDGIFLGIRIYNASDTEAVTPGMVANAIDYYHTHGNLDGF